MIQFLAWYILLTLLGWSMFPLAWRLFPALADRGFTLTRALGLLLWGYLFWVLASLGVIQNDGSGLLLTLLVVAGLSAWSSWRKLWRGPSSIVAWVRSKSRLIITVEVLFFLSFALWAFVRASNPNIETAGGEKTMELAFINSILRSPTFPPADPWLSGYSISYYYFGYVMTAMLARITATPGAVAHNLMSALIFSLSFIGAYGILYNLLAAWQKQKSGKEKRRSILALPLLGPLFLLFISNVAGFLEVINRRGIGWSGQPGDTNLWSALGKLVRPNLQAYNFWTWLDILHLSDPPNLPYKWIPDRFIWWWQDSRVIQDYDLAGRFTEVIDEFPAFSYMLGDLHPHVLAMPFGLMAVAFALNLFLGGWKGLTNFRLYRLPVNPLNLISGALLLGGLAFLNTWDILPGFALLGGAYVLHRVREAGWSWKRLQDLIAFGLPLGVLAILLYLPFYVGFSSQLGGILPNLEYPSRGAQLWVMFGTLFLPLLVYLLHLWRGRKFRSNWWAGFALGIGFTIFLWTFSWVLGFLAQAKMPEFTAGYLQAQGFVSTALFFGAALTRRLAYIGGLLTLLALLIPSIGLLAGKDRLDPDEKDGKDGKDEKEESASPESIPDEDAAPGRKIIPPVKPRPSLYAFPSLAFTIFMVLLGTLLVLAPEFVYLRDLFGTRMNTIFKFYYQAWILWSLASAFGVAVMLRELRGVWNWVFTIGLSLLLLVGLAFPIFGLPHKTDDLQIPVFKAAFESARDLGDPNPLRTAIDSTWTLDGSLLFHRQYPDDAAAADWLASAPLGVVAEAVGGSYTSYARISAYSGQQTVVGWIGHEDQWRGTFEEQRQRGEHDIPVLYQTTSWDEALAIIQKYDIRYIVVGTLERNTYRVYESNFQLYLVPVFRSGEVVIYQVP
jgi:YYY domain-containing protein